MTWVTCAALFGADCFLAYAAGRWLEAWDRNRLWNAIKWEVLMGVVGGVNLGAFIEIGWQLGIPVSTLGACCGTALAFVKRKPRGPHA